MARPVRIDPRGGPVSLFGDMLGVDPRALPLKIDLWRRVRHPPPEILHAKTLKAGDEPNDYVVVPFPGGLIGRVISWTWDLRSLPPDLRSWRVVLDVKQRDVSVEGYPIEYEGVFEPGTTYDELKISEPMVDASGAAEFSSAYQVHKRR